MNCSQCQDLLVEYSLGELEPPAANEVAQHLAGGCADCGRELLELKESLAMVGHSLNPVPAPLRVKHDLLTRIRAEREQADDAGPATLPFPVPKLEQHSVASRVLPFAAAILVGFTVGTLATKYYAGGGAGANREALLAEMIEEARKSLGSPEVQFAALHAPQNADEVVGHLMWDTRGRSLHFFAFDLLPPAPGKALVVWLETRGGKMVRAGELELSQRGSTSEVFSAPEGGADFTAVVVTEESDESVTSPQGPQRIFARFGAPGDEPGAE